MADRPYYVLVSSAAAKVPFEAVSDLLVVRFGVGA